MNRVCREIARKANNVLTGCVDVAIPKGQRCKAQVGREHQACAEAGRMPVQVGRTYLACVESARQAIRLAKRGECVRARRVLVGARRSAKILVAA